jgi:hypothetical protein
LWGFGATALVHRSRILLFAILGQGLLGYHPNPEIFMHRSAAVRVRPEFASSILIFGGVVNSPTVMGFPVAPDSKFGMNRGASVV